MFGFLRPGAFQPTPVMAGPRLYLRPPRYRDWRAWASLRAISRDFLAPWEPTWSHDSLGRRAFLRRIRQQAAESREDHGYGFFIFRKEDDALLGGVTVADVRRGVSMSCSLGYWIGEPYARQGYMTEALRCLLPFLFDTLGLNRVEAACLPNNVASRRLLNKLGYQEQGYVREYLRINGVWHDHVLFALLASDCRAGLSGRDPPAGEERPAANLSVAR